MKLLLALSLLTLRGARPATSHQTVNNSTAIAGTLEWVLDFSGRCEQIFHVQYKNESAEKWHAAPGVPQELITDPGPKKLSMDLKSNIWYVFRVRSKSFHPENTSDLSNVTSAKTPGNRSHNKVTVRWKQETRRKPVLNIRYCPIGTEDCTNYTVRNQEDIKATFFVDADKIYHYYTMVEDDDDAVYRSFISIVHTYEELETHDKILVAVVGVMVGAAVMAITDTIVAVVLWKRGRLLCKKRQKEGPANDTLEDAWIEFKPSGQSVSYIDIGVSIGATANEYENDTLCRKRLFGLNQSLQRQTAARQQGASGSDSVVTRQNNPTDYATPYAHVWLNVSRETQTDDSLLRATKWLQGTSTFAASNEARADYSTPYEHFQWLNDAGDKHEGQPGQEPVHNEYVNGHMAQHCAPGCPNPVTIRQMGQTGYDNLNAQFVKVSRETQTEDEEPARGDDADYVLRSTTWMHDTPTFFASKDSQTDFFDELGWQNVSDENQMWPLEVDPEGTYNDLRIVMQGDGRADQSSTRRRSKTS